MKFWSFFWGLACLAYLPTHAQNLVPNPDFEQYNELPQNTSEIHKCKDWFNPAGSVALKKATPDYYHQKGGQDVRLPSPTWASGLEVLPQSGDAIAGIIATNNLNTREYLCVKLIEPLQKGKEYHISFYYCQGAGKALGALSTSLGVGFSAKRPWQRHTEVISPKVKLQQKEVWESREWKRFECAFKPAEDSLAYFLIGNFEEKGEIKKSYDLNKAIFAQWAYYFIDSVAVLPAQPTHEEIKISKEEEQLLERASYVQFKTNEALILPESYFILDEVVNLLNRYPTGKLNLEGHTDNVGTAERNLMLSQARAESIKVYFTMKGIKPDRIQTQGFGLSKPKDTNETEAGKAKNRRVEMKFKASF